MSLRISSGKDEKPAQLILAGSSASVCLSGYEVTESSPIGDLPWPMQLLMCLSNGHLALLEAVHTSEIK